MTQIIVVSNRGPVSASFDQTGKPNLKRGAGGLVTALLPLMKNKMADWVFPISAPAELEAHKKGMFKGDIPGLHPATIPIEIHDAAYNKISNEILWYLNHGMFSLSRNPSFDTRFYLWWSQYQQYSRLIAKSISDLAGQNAKVMLQDYHMFLVAGYLGETRPDLEQSLFLHTPFANPSEFDVLPRPIALEILTSLAQLTHIGFHASKWRDNYVSTTTDFGVSLAKNVWVNPLGSDIDELNQVVKSAETRLPEISSIAQNRRIIARSDRMEPSKNILRGIDSIVELFRFFPNLLSSVVHIANCYPSREAILDYANYASEVKQRVQEANQYLEALAKNLGIQLPSKPIVLFANDDFELSVALLTSYDVLLVNPIRDGLNLVATEGPLINTKHGILVLSENAGIVESLGDVAMVINPFDIRQTALALADALSVTESDKESSNTILKNKCLISNPKSWFENQIKWFESTHLA